MLRIYKLIAISLLIVFSMTASLAFADTSSKRSGNDGASSTKAGQGTQAGQQTSNSQGSQVQTRPQENERREIQQAFMFKNSEDTELLANLNTVKANQTKILALRQQLKALVQEVKKETKELRKDPNSVTQSQVNALREALPLVKTEINDILATKDKMSIATQNLRQGRQQRDVTACKANLKLIIQNQEQRIQTLQKAIGTLQSLVGNL